MISAADTEFPNNVIALLAARVPDFCDPSPAPGTQQLKVFKRPLRTTDPTQTVGLFPAMKRPDNTSFEITSLEPTLKRYSVIMQTVVQDTDEAACISVHSILSNRLWRMFYRDSPLNIGLTALGVDANNSRERLQRRGIELQRYLSNEIQGTYIQTSWIECWFETETVETQ
jgi:hypothetical protein